MFAVSQSAPIVALICDDSDRLARIKALLVRDLQPIELCCVSSAAADAALSGQQIAALLLACDTCPAEMPGIVEDCLNSNTVPVLWLPGSDDVSQRRLWIDAGGYAILSEQEIDQGALKEVLERLLSADRLAALEAELCQVKADLGALQGVLIDASDGLILLADDGRVLMANSAAEQMLGQQTRDLQQPPQFEPLAVGRTHLVNHTDPFGFTRRLEVRVAATQWKTRPARVMILHDVTERDASKRELDLLSRAVDAANDGIVICDMQRADAPIIYVNAAFEDITGYSAIEVIGRNCRFMQGEDRDQASVDTMRKALQAQRRCTVVVRNFRKDGSLFWNRLTLAPVRNAAEEITHYIGIQTDVTSQIALEQERIRLLSHDALTGLPNFVAAHSRLEAQVQRALADNLRLGLMYIDLDDFNAVNDSVGFSSGDAALKVVAERLRAAAGKNAEVIRYAGDEFLVALPELSATDSPLLLAEHYCECISAPITTESGATLYLSASAGVSALPDTGYTAAELVRQADVALKRAKGLGRGSAVLFDSDMRNAREDGLMLGGRMRDAIGAGEFLLHYLPIVDARSTAIVAVEALVRWDSPELGLLPPLRFIPVAENNGLIVELGRWVLREACRQMKAWRDAGVNQVTVCVNVSAVQLQRHAFVEELGKTIREFDIDPASLELELTETMLIEHTGQIEERLHALRKLGVRLVLDDFGMGFSSLSYLHRFPLDKLKIDQSFVRDITVNSSHATLTRAIIGMGHQLGLQVVAEGIETVAQYSYLKRNHCDQFQGFLFSRAVDAVAMEALLRKRYLTLDDGDAPTSRSVDRTLLLVDDEANILRALQRLFRRDGYKVLAANNAEEGLELLASSEVHVVISDQRMPGLDGTEFLGKVKLMYPDTIRMVLSGYTELSSVIDAVNEGAIYKFLTKPWDADHLRQVVLDAFRLYEERLKAEARS